MARRFGFELEFTNASHDLLTVRNGKVMWDVMMMAMPKFCLELDRYCSFFPSATRQDKAQIRSDQTRHMARNMSIMR